MLCSCRGGGAGRRAPWMMALASVACGPTAHVEPAPPKPNAGPSSGASRLVPVPAPVGTLAMADDPAAVAAFVEGPCAAKELVLSEAARACPCMPTPETAVGFRQELCEFDEDEDSERVKENLRVSLELQRLEVAPGDTLSLAVIWQNVGSEPLKLRFPGNYHPELETIGAAPSSCDEPKTLYGEPFAAIQLPPGGKLVAGAMWIARRSRQTPLGGDLGCQTVLGPPLARGRYTIRYQGRTWSPGGEDSTASAEVSVR